MPTGTVALERDADLTTLVDAVRSAAAGAGSVVLVAGEAGIGKSRLVAELRDRLPRGVRLLEGHCDDLVTPRVLGPLRDLAGAAGADLARALRSPGERDALFAAVLGELDRADHPTVLVVEDVHWVDEATLELLRWLVRRVAGLPAVLALTYRDDELDDGHPLHRLLATTATLPGVRRVVLRPLSPAAVATLLDQDGDVDAMVALTGGNPFLVHEVLAAGPGVPASVSDLTRARLQRLDAGSREAVERISVITAPLGRDLVDALVPGGPEALDAAERHGLLVVEPGRVRFRHELTRRAVVDGLTVSRRTALNAAALGVLEALPDPDLAALVHHARQAGDTAAVVRHAPAAARAAATGRAHREAAEHLRVVLDHRDAIAPDDLPDLLEASAIECYTVGDHGRSALADQREAVTLRRRRDDPVALGASLRGLSRIAWWVGDRPLAERAAGEAVEVLRPTADRRELALALSNTSQLAMLADRTHEAVDTARQVVDLAHEIDDPAVLSHALNNLGTALWARGDAGGRALVEQARDIAVAAGLTEHASRAWCNLTWQLLLQLRPDEAAHELVAGIRHAEGAEQVVFWKYLHVERGLVALAGARWAAATADAAVALEATSPIRCTALFVLGRSALRTGAASDELVQECWSLGRQLDELQRTAPAAALVCEQAWLRGDAARLATTVLAVARPVYDEAVRLGALVWAVELAHWLRMAGHPVDPAELAGVDHPYADSARGDHAAAARAWARAGYPYEAAAAEVESEDEAGVLRGLAALDALGGVALADRVRGGLRRRGLTGVPRGPSYATRDNPAGLTRRQLEVLDLLDDALSNAAIAERLMLSVRTVDRHVSDLLHKLGATSRTEAPGLARRLGWRRTRPGSPGSPG